MIDHHETDDGVALSEAIGVRSLGGPPLTPDDAFPIASVTKPYTATLVLQFHDEGLLDLDEPAARWLNGDLATQMLIINGESFGHRVTARHLMNHTSGLCRLA